MLRYLIVILALPFADFYVLLRTSEMFGILPTIGAVLATGLIGAELIRREGLGIVQRLGTAVTAKEASRNLIEAVLLAFGGLSLLTPGFITDGLGLVLVLRPTRQRLMLHLSEKLDSKAQFEIRTL